MSTDINKLIEYIQLFLNEGKSKNEIYKQLLNQGWMIDDIQKAFDQIVNKEEKEVTRKKIINIILIIGAILIGVGIFSFVAANWQKIAKLTKILIIIIGIVSSYIGGWFFKEKWYYKKTGEALFLLGAIIFGAGIFLIGQMFHVKGNWPDGFILWMIGIIVMAFAIDFFALFWLAILVGIVAIFAYTFGIFKIFYNYDPFLLTSPFLLLVATIVNFISGWFMKKRIPPELKEFY